MPHKKYPFRDSESNDSLSHNMLNFEANRSGTRDRRHTLFTSKSTGLHRIPGEKKDHRNEITGYDGIIAQFKIYLPPPPLPVLDYNLLESCKRTGVCDVSLQLGSRRPSCDQQGSKTEQPSDKEGVSSNFGSVFRYAEKFCL